MEAITFEKVLENKENFISQKLEMGIPLKEGSIGKADEGKRQYVFKNLKQLLLRDKFRFIIHWGDLGTYGLVIDYVLELGV